MDQRYLEEEKRRRTVLCTKDAHVPTTVADVPIENAEIPPQSRSEFLAEEW